jgi:hypothetical protein
LAQAHFGEPAITRTLAAALKIPICRPMAKQDDLHQYRGESDFFKRPGINFDLGLGFELVFEL